MAPELAIDGGRPVRETMLAYGRQWIDDEDVQAVVRVLRSDWLTTGPAVRSFEQELCRTTGAADVVAVSNGTAALHAAMYGLGIGPGDEVIVPAMTFAATANCVVYQGGTPVFADVDPETLLIDVSDVARKVTPRTRAVIGVDYAGQPCDYTELRSALAGTNIAIVADAAHSLGARDRDVSVGSLADLTTFSFHPVKQVTTGEGGAVAVLDDARSARVRLFRNHGISSDHRQREEAGSWYYEMVDLGFNYRITDFQCALGESQLTKLPRWLDRRREIAARYDRAFADVEAITPLQCRPGVSHAYHLYVIRVDARHVRVGRDDVFRALRAEGIGVNVHYIPVHLHPFYRNRYGTGPGLCPEVERAYEQILSLPIFPRMSDRDVEEVVEAVVKVVHAYHA